MAAYIFPGQGSQFRGMGIDVFSEFSEFTSKANEILGYSIERLCLEDTYHQLDQTQYTQPALYVVNALSYLKKIAGGKTQPSYVAGHSLGEYNALFAAGVIDFETGLKIVQKRGMLMSKADGGMMAAVIGLSLEHIKNLLKQHRLTHISIANHNSFTQVVLSGLKADIEQAKIICEQAGAILVIALKVSGAFHSLYMENAQTSFRDFVNQFKFSPPQIPVIANTTAKPYTFSDIPELMIYQITQPVRWVESIQYIINQHETEFEEVGPGNVLTGLIRRIQNGQ